MSLCLISTMGHDYKPPCYTEYAALSSTPPFSKHCLGLRAKQKLSFIPPKELFHLTKRDCANVKEDMQNITSNLFFSLERIRQ